MTCVTSATRLMAGGSGPPSVMRCAATSRGRARAVAGPPDDQEAVTDFAESLGYLQSAGGGRGRRYAVLFGLLMETRRARR